MALRELLLHLGVDVDDQGVKKANGALNNIRKAAIAAGAIFVTGKFAQGIGKILELGSAANETSNVIQSSFGESADSVEDWAKRQADAMGRSKFELREMAAATGAIVEPMLKSEKGAADMATQVAQLAVDLGSFFNTSDPAALKALQAGLVGSTEPLLKFGVVMLQANLQAFALEKGITKQVSAMSAAEKTQLRFNFIMENTRKAQGDAAKTSEGYANKTKALQAAVKDSFTEIGKRLVPVFEKLLKVLVPLTKRIGIFLVRAIEVLDGVIGGLVSAVEVVMDTFRGTDGIIEKLALSVGLLGIAMLLFGRKAVFAAIRVAAAWALANLPIIAMLAILAVVLLVIEDVVKFFKGAPSLIGTLVDAFKQWVDDMGGVSEALLDLWKKIFTNMFGISEKTFDEIIEKIGEAIATLTDFLGLTDIAAEREGIKRAGRSITRRQQAQVSRNKKIELQRRKVINDLINRGAGEAITPTVSGGRLGFKPFPGREAEAQEAFNQQFSSQINVQVDASGNRFPSEVGEAVGRGVEKVQPRTSKSGFVTAKAP